MSNNTDKKRMSMEIFLKFLRIGTFTFGSGYAMIPMIKREVVEQKKWLSEEEMVDMVAISEATPGPIMVNVATFVGSRLAGTLGALAATLGVILPAFAMIILVATVLSQINDMEIVQFAFKGIRAGVLVLIINAIMTVFHNCEKNIVSYAIIAVAFVLVAFGGTNAVYIIIAAALAGIVISKVRRRK